MDSQAYRKAKAAVAKFEQLEKLLTELNLALDTLNSCASGDYSKIRALKFLTLSINQKDTVEINLSQCAADSNSYWVQDFQITRALMDVIQKTKERVVKELNEL